MPDQETFYERIAGRSPNVAGFSRSGDQRATHKVIIGDKGNGSGAITSGQELHDAIREVLGYTRRDPNSAGLQRILPKAHPLYPWLFAERISNMVGIGQMTRTTAGNELLEADTFDEVALYDSYELEVEFRPRPYPVLPDDHIRNVEDTDGKTLTWTPPTGSAGAVNKTFSREWLRYCDVEYLPSLEYLVAEAGQFKIDVAANQEPKNKPAGQGQIKMPFPESFVKMTWFEIPYTFVFDPGTTSYIEQGLGMVNQRDWFGFDKGTLLFAGVQINRYAPPVPDFDYWASTVAFAGEKLCDITFLFKFRDPTLGKDAAGNTATPDAPPDPPGNNAIQQGWNLVPFSHLGQWYYAKTVDQAAFTNAEGFPIHNSFPFELLFTDPSG